MTPLSALADRYVRLALRLHNHDANPYVYFGPETLRAEAQAHVTPLPELDRALLTLRDDIAEAPIDEPHGALRRAILADRAEAMIVRSGILQGRFPASFDEETQALYAVSAAERNEDHFRALARDLETIIPGAGPLPARLEAFRDRFLMPPERIEDIMTTALQEARRRARAQMTLPEEEEIRVQIDRSGPFVGFAEYRGGGRSIIHFNAAAPIHLDRVIELATHEAYPGHHVQATLMEAELVRRRGWREWTMSPLFGAHTVLAEGAANYGVTLSFSRAERIDYDREVILPMAGLRHMKTSLEDYHRFVDLVEQLNHARNVAARGYLYDGWARERAISWLMEFGLETKDTATQRLAFIEAMRSYVVTYNHGLDWVTREIERMAPAGGAARWSMLQRALEAPLLPIRAR